MHESSPLALIGCGAISEAAYLPALAANPRWRNALWLVEPNARRGADIAQRFGFSRDRIVPRHDDLPDGLSLAINATPSHLHRPITTALIDRGVGVLVEKPFSENANDARAMVAAAAAKGTVLSVNQSRRAGPSNKLIRDVIRSGTLGRIETITWSEGRPFDWPTQSGFNFRRPWQGRPRGVLLDIGVHVLDLLCWWLDETPMMVSARLDGQGGPEATAAVKMAIGGATLDLRLSYLVKLRNELLIEGTLGSLRASTADYDRVEFRAGQGRWRSLRAGGSTDAIVNTSRLIANVSAAAAGREALAIDAASTIPALAAIDDIYARADDLLSDCYVEHLAETTRVAARASEGVLA